MYKDPEVKASVNYRHKILPLGHTEVVVWEDLWNQESKIISNRYQKRTDPLKQVFLETSRENTQKGKK